jgi:hypothetical protein
MLPRHRWEARSGSDGYAVFEQVIGGGISVIEAVGAVPVYDESLMLTPLSPNCRFSIPRSSRKTS